MNESRVAMELDSESRQIREVFASYGLAMYLAQNLERALAMALAVEGKSELMTSWDYDSRLAEYFLCTFGELVTKFRSSSDDKPPGLSERLDKANDLRNDLAHKFFWDRAIKFNSNEGRSDMLSELYRIKEEFDSLDEELTKLTNERVKWRGYNIEQLEAQADVHLKEMLTGGKSAHNPEVVPKQIEIVAAHEWRSGLTRHGNIVLLAKDGRHLVPGEKGLCYGPLSVPAGITAMPLPFDKALPATVNPRPKTSSPWNYAIPLAHGHVLRVSSEEAANDTKHFRVWLQTPQSKARVATERQ